MSAVTIQPDPYLSLIMDGRRVSAAQGDSLLQAARGAGVTIPTLCDHPDLDPVGACRLCMVEVTHPDWGGWSGLMTACLYPAAQDLVVLTHSDKVMEVRRGVLSLLAARCPSSEVLQAMALEHGAALDRLFVDPEGDDCILCGLCTRVCEAFATSAISTTNRGIKRRVGSPFDVPPPDCIGCGACALICPTGHIQDKRSPGSYSIWGREFPTSPCAVIVGRCAGCGACEEACPFDVPRVVLQRSGLRYARISAAQCRGCGACVGSCPNGAIMQKGDPPPMPGQGPAEESEAGSVAVVACGRSALGGPLSPLPEVARLTEVPCTGRITLNQILRHFALGADGVLVLGRHQETCRQDGAEEPAKERVARARALLELLGLGGERVRFESPAAGSAMPARAVARFLADITPLGLRPGKAEELPWTGEDLAGGLKLLAGLSRRSVAGIQAETYLEQRELPCIGDGEEGWKLWAGDIPYLQMLGGELWSPTPLDFILTQGVAVLRSLLGHEGGVQIGPCGGEAGDAMTLEKLDALLRQRGTELPRPSRIRVVACSGTDREKELIEALGHRALVTEPIILPGGLAMGPAHRKQAEVILAAAERAGADSVLMGNLEEHIKWLLVSRDGTWRSSRVRPLLGVQLAAASLEAAR